MERQPLQERYQIRQTLGAGGYGEVFLAHDQQLERLVAVKRLRSPYFSPQINARFQQEALIMARIKHPHILAIYDVFESDGRLCLVMEYSETGSLKKFLEGNGRLTVTETVELGKSLASGLDAAHRQGIIHRDVKPGNVLLLPAGDGLLAKLADFGIAHSPNRDEELTQTGDLLGTPP
jgi:serine/threonine protein kinase